MMHLSVAARVMHRGKSPECVSLNPNSHLPWEILPCCIQQWSVLHGTIMWSSPAFS